MKSGDKTVCNEHFESDWSSLLIKDHCSSIDLVNPLFQNIPKPISTYFSANRDGRWIGST